MISPEDAFRSSLCAKCSVELAVLLHVLQLVTVGTVVAFAHCSTHVTHTLSLGQVGSCSITCMRAWLTASALPITVPMATVSLHVVVN
jgi:mannose/fructose/N-acetylgalactosamine-specific phosphotransferase system component IIC